jgi:tetratricopeptide (TPR) repeat protein
VVATAGARRPWFFGPASDLLFGCGLLYVGLFALQALDGPAMRRLAPPDLAPFITILLGMPHYGATLLRVYSRREDRRRYAFFAIWSTAAIAAAFVAGLHNLWLGSLLVTIYFTWSPWHYSSQNYGIALLFLRRRGVTVTPAAKGWLRAGFVLSYALVILTFQGDTPGTLLAPGDYVGTVYEYLRLGIPEPSRDLLATVVSILYAASVAASAALLLRVASPRDLAPTALVVLVQALWFLLPAAARVWKGLAVVEPFGESGVAYAFLWVQVGHFVQYLWITSYYSGASATRARRARFLAGSLLAGAAVWTLPPLLFAPGALGRLPFDMGLALLAAAVVNIHHFVLDGAIWKLRDGRIARALLREPADPAPEPVEPARRWRTAPVLIGAAGALSLAVAAVAAREGVAGNRAFGRADVERAKLALARLSRLGQDSPRIRAVLGEYALRFETRAAARRQIDQSLALWPTAAGWIALGHWYEAGGAPAAAREAYARALALAPDDRIARASFDRLRFATGGYGPDDRRPAPPAPDGDPGGR